MRGNFQVRFLGEEKAVMSFSYPTLYGNEGCQFKPSFFVCRQCVTSINNELAKAARKKQTTVG